MNGAQKHSFGKSAQRSEPLFDVLERIKLWPSRGGCLHGVKTVTRSGGWVELETHCGMVIRVKDSKNGRAKRQLIHGYVNHVCKSCRIPDWKIKKFNDRLSPGKQGKPHISV